MADLGSNPQNRGSWLVAAAALAGCAVSVFNYFSPASGIAGEPGTLLVIASTALLAVFGLLLARDLRPSGFVRGFITISALLNIGGTSLAAYLLHAQALVFLMLAALIGWLIHFFGPRPVSA